MVCRERQLLSDSLRRGASSSEQQSLFSELFKGEYPANTLVEITALAEPGLDVEMRQLLSWGEFPFCRS